MMLVAKSKGAISKVVQKGREAKGGRYSGQNSVSKRHKKESLKEQVLLIRDFES